jgi:hypothetical protein
MPDYLRRDPLRFQQMQGGLGVPAPLRLRPGQVKVHLSPPAQQTRRQAVLIHRGGSVQRFADIAELGRHADPVNGDIRGAEAGPGVVPILAEQPGQCFGAVKSLPCLAAIGFPRGDNGGDQSQSASRRHQRRVVGPRAAGQFFSQLHRNAFGVIQLVCPQQRTDHLVTGHPTCGQ